MFEPLGFEKRVTEGQKTQMFHGIETHRTSLDIEQDNFHQFSFGRIQMPYSLKRNPRRSKSTMISKGSGAIRLAMGS